MAQELASQRFCTLTHYVQLSVDSVLVLHIHTLPENEDAVVWTSQPSGPSASVGLPPPFSWLAERHMQELLVMVHEVVQEKAVRGLLSEPAATGKKNGAAAGTPDLQLKRGTSVRVLFSFKPHQATQHIVLPTNPSLSPLLPSAETFVNDQGRLVFESSGFSTSGGEYRPFRAVQDALHVFVDQYEPTSHQGVIKIMLLLDPGHKQSLDVLSYFLPPRKRESSSSSGEGEGGDGPLADLPVDGLKRRRGGGGRGRGRGRGGRGREKSTARGKSGTRKKMTSKSRGRGKRLVADHQPTIVQSLADIDTSKLTSDFSMTSRLSKPPPPPPLPPPVAVRGSTSSCDVDELFGMDSHWLSEDEESQSNDLIFSGTVETPGISSSGSGDNPSPTDPDLCGDDISTGQAGSSSLYPSSPASCVSIATPVLDTERRDEEGIEGQGVEVMITSPPGVETAVDEKQTRREVSPDLWSLDSQSGSQPLDDITNSLSGTSSAVPPSSRKKTLSPDSQQGGTAANQAGEGFIVIVSDDDDDNDDKASAVGSADNQQSQGAEGPEKKTKRKKKGKRKAINLETLFRGAEEVRDIPGRSVSRWLAHQKQLLIDIFQRRVYSRRHESYISGTKGRVVLLHQISHHLFTKEQRDAITSGLMHAFCHKNMNLFSYVMSVLYPECLIRLIMDFQSVSFEEAEKKMLGLDKFVDED